MRPGKGGGKESEEAELLAPPPFSLAACAHTEAAARSFEPCPRWMLSRVAAASEAAVAVAVAAAGADFAARYLKIKAARWRRGSGGI